MKLFSLTRSITIDLGTANTIIMEDDKDGPTLRGGYTLGLYRRGDAHRARLVRARRCP